MRFIGTWFLTTTGLRADEKGSIIVTLKIRG